MTTVATIVEGDGEVAAVPVLLRRLGIWLTPDRYVTVLPPLRVRRDQFLNKPDVFARMLHLAAQKCTSQGWVLVLLDADDDCPALLADDIGRRAAAIIPGTRLSVVLPNREFEAWFIAAAGSLNGHRHFSYNGVAPEADAVRGAKEWISEKISGGRYRPILDQPAFCASMNLDEAFNNSRSFKKLCGEWQKQAVLPA